MVTRFEWMHQLLFDVLPAAVRIAAIARRWRADAIHTNEQLLSNLAGILASKLAGLPCFSHNRMWGVSPRLIKFFGPMVAHCFAVSEFIRRDLIAGGVPASKVSVAYDGVDLEKFAVREPVEDIRRELGIPAGACVLGLFGRVVEWKGHAFFLKALSSACEQDASLYGLIVGDTSPPGGPLLQGLRSLSQELGLRDRVLFTGYRTDVARLMTAADVIVVPSVEPDPFPGVILETMASSRPVIATRIGGIPEAIQDGENGLLIAVGDVGEFFKAILRLSREPQFAKALGRKGRNIAEQRFTTTALAQAVSTVYESIIW